MVITKVLEQNSIAQAVAGYRVGYDDASYFNREYKRHFGVPPTRNVGQLREAVVIGSDIRQAIGNLMHQPSNPIKYCG